MVKSFKKETKKKKNRYYLYYMIFKVFFNCFFSKFQFQNWNLGNLWSSKKKKNHYYLYYMIFKVFFNCFFFKFQFQNWNLGNLWSSSPSISVNNFKIHPKFLNLKEVQTQQDTTSPILTHKHTHQKQKHIQVEWDTQIQ